MVQKRLRSRPFSPHFSIKALTFASKGVCPPSMEVSFQFSGLFGLSKTLGQTNEFNELSATQKAPFWHLNFPKSRRAGQQTLSSGLYTNVTECLERGALQRTPTDKFVQSVAPLAYCSPILKQFLFHSPTHSLTTKVKECKHIFTNFSHTHEMQETRLCYLVRLLLLSS